MPLTHAGANNGISLQFYISLTKQHVTITLPDLSQISHTSFSELSGLNCSKFGRHRAVSAA